MGADADRQLPLVPEQALQGSLFGAAAPSDSDSSSSSSPGDPDLEDGALAAAAAARPRAHSRRSLPASPEPDETPASANGATGAQDAAAADQPGEAYGNNHETSLRGKPWRVLHNRSVAKCNLKPPHFPGRSVSRTAASACSMPTVKLGRKEFDVDSEEINASGCGVSAADCVAFAARMRTGEISRVKKLDLVSFCFVVVF